MGSRGRHSAAEFELIHGGLATPLPVGKRPKPPPELSPEEAREWRAIVDDKPADHFTREMWGLLVQLCQSKVSLDYLARVKRALHRKPLAKFDATAYNQISNLQAREARTLRGAMAELRRYAAKREKNAGGGKPLPPWADEDEED
jgi:hypothetical protein